MGKLERKLDFALIERMSNGSQAKPEQSPQAKRALRQQIWSRRLANSTGTDVGRSNLTYRGARRNNDTHTAVDTRDGTFRGSIRPNSSSRSSGRGEEFLPAEHRGNSGRGTLFIPNGESNSTGDTSSMGTVAHEAETGGTESE